MRLQACMSSSSHWARHPLAPCMLDIQHSINSLSFSPPTLSCSPTNFDPQNDALLTWVQRQAPAAAQGTTSFPGSEGQASVPESKGSGGLVDISAWKREYLRPPICKFV